MNLEKLFTNTVKQTANLIKVCGRVKTDFNPTGSLKSFKSKVEFWGLSADSKTIKFLDKKTSEFYTFSFDFEITSEKPKHSVFTAKLV